MLGDYDGQSQLLQETRQNSTSELSTIQKQIEAANNSQNEMQVKVKEIEDKIVQLEQKRDKVRTNRCSGVTMSFGAEEIFLI